MSATLKLFLPLLCWWRFLGLLPVSRVDVRKLRVRSSSLASSVSLVIIAIVTIAHVSRQAYFVLARGRALDFADVMPPVFGVTLVLQVAIFSRKSCRLIQEVIRSITHFMSVVKMTSVSPLLPVFNVARCLGLLPYSELEGSGVKLKMKKSQLIHVIGLAGIAALSLAAGACLSENVLHILGNLQSPSISSDITDFLLKCFSIVLAITIVVFTRGSCELMTKYLRYLVKVDGALMSSPGNPRRGLVHVVLSGTIWTARAALTIWLFDMPRCDILLFPLWFVVLGAEQLTVVLCQELARRYRAINTALQSMRPPKKHTHEFGDKIRLEELRADKLLETKLAWLEPVKQDPSTTLTPARVECLREAHSSLADAFQELNNKLGVFLLIDLAYLFIMLLSTSISFLQHCIIQSTDHRGHTNSCVGYSVLAMDGLVRMAIITVSCGAVGEEAERTAEAAARLLRRALDWDALREILGAQVRARRVAFWACGLFTVDRPLLFSICGAVTSYLFILSQLNKS